MPLIEKIKRELPGSTDSFLINRKTKDRFSRILGGLAWPGKNPGFAIVVGESYEIDKTLQKRHYHILAEYESQSVGDLIRRCAEFRVNLCASPFYGDDEKRWAMDILRKSRIGLYITAAPYHDDPTAFEGYLLTIRELTHPVKKRLHFGSKSHLPALLAALSANDIVATAKVAFEQHPAIAALGYAVTALEFFAYSPNEQAEVDKFNAELETIYED